MIIVEILLLAIGFALLIKGADWFVDGCSHLASSLGVSQIVIGLTIVAMGTSMPEAAVSITAAMKNTADIAVGNIVGSNIINILIILGLTSLLIPIPVDETFRRKDIPFMGTATILLVVMGMTGNIITRAEGMILFALFMVYLLYLFRSTISDKSRIETKTVSGKQVLRDLMMIIVGVGLVVAGSNMAVDAAAEIARMAGMTEKLIGLTIVALGTSLPELVTSLTAARKGNADMAIGNIVGNNIFNILFILSASSIIVPIPYVQSFLMDGLIALTAMLILWVYALVFKRLDRVSGVIMLALYAGYFAYLVLSGS